MFDVRDEKHIGARCIHHDDGTCDCIRGSNQ